MGLSDIAVTVVVCTYNRAELVAACVDSLLEQRTEFPYEVVVIDDGSTDDTASVLGTRARRGNGELVYRGFQNGGLNVARNRGLQAARGQIVAYIDDDEIVPPEYLAKVVAILSGNPQIDGVGGPCVELESRGGPRTCAGCSLANADVRGEGVRLSFRLLGGNMAIRKEVFSEVGFFDESLSGRGDDDEWFYRANLAGKAFQQDPSLWVWHRKDHLSLAGLVRHGFKQGLSVPKAQELKGITYAPRWKKLSRALFHFVRRRCAKGLWDASRELGSALAWMVHRFRVKFLNEPESLEKGG